MYPACRHMDLRHPTNGYIPTFRAHPGADSSKQSEACKPWPSSPNNYGFPVSGYGYSGYGDYPVHHGSYLPYAYPAPSQFFCCGHQPYPGPFCPPYYPPPPYYRMELNPDGYRKEGGLNSEVRHCCGCPNHTHSEKIPQVVKVEELEPDAKGKQVDSFVPLQRKDNTYPIVWIPGESMHNRDDVQQLHESRGANEARNSDVSPEQNKLSMQQPNGWFPLDVEHLASLFGDGNKRIPSHRDGDKKEFQVPFVWMPSRQDQQHSYKGTDENSNDPSHPVFKLFRPEHLRVKNSVDKPPEVKEDPNRSQGGSGKEEKHEKTIPVTEVKPCKDYENSEEKVGCDRVGSSARAKDDVKSKITEAKRQPSSPPKTAKLSPVCLRVDPLPKKKNGSSRSPSPHGGSKWKKLETSEDSCKTTAVTDIEVKDHKNSLGVGNTRTKEEKDETNADDNTDTLLQPASESSIPQRHDIAIVSETGELKHQGHLTNESTMVSKEPTDLATLANGGQTERVKRFSKEEAAKLIQSVYRGYYVRKCEPLKKLKQIAGLREQMTGVKNGIHALETSTECDEKQKAAIGEMIMSLLLKLDSIQGLLPNLRDLRKSVARELVALQEELDSLEIKKQEVPKSSGGNYIGNNETENSGENPCTSLEDDGCDTCTLSSVIKEAAASEVVGSSSIHDPNLKSSDGDLLSNVDERTEDIILTNIGVEQSVPQVEGCDPEGKPIVTGEAMEMIDSTHDDMLKGSTPGGEERPSEDKWNSASEGFKETDKLEETPAGLGVIGEERGVKPEEQSNEGFDDEVPEKKVKAYIPAGEATEGEEVKEFCDFRDVEQKRCASGSVEVKGDDEPAIKIEPLTMEKEVAESGAAEPNVGGIEGVPNEGGSSITTDQSSQAGESTDVMNEAEKKASESEEDIAATELDLNREMDGDEKSDNLMVAAGRWGTVLGNEDEHVVGEKEENARRMKEMMEKLVEAGNAQMEVISKLSSRVNDLEKKLCSKKSTRRRCRSAKKKDLKFGHVVN